MATESDHKLVAERNLEVATSVVDTYPEWGTIAAFYAALHRVCEVCATYSITHAEHSERNEYVKKNLRGVWKPYKFLYDESMKARYLTAGVYSLSAAEVRKQVIESAYGQVEHETNIRRKTPLITAEVAEKVIKK